MSSRNVWAGKIPAHKLEVLFWSNQDKIEIHTFGGDMSSRKVWAGKIPAPNLEVLFWSNLCKIDNTLSAGTCPRQKVVLKI